MKGIVDPVPVALSCSRFATTAVHALRNAFTQDPERTAVSSIILLAAMPSARKKPAREGSPSCRLGEYIKNNRGKTDVLKPKTHVA